MAAQYDIIVENEEYTVVSEYEAEYRSVDRYQSEAQLEKDFIKTLTEQGYEYLPIHEEKDLVDNLRVQLQRLNDYTFSDAEWKRFFNDNLAEFQPLLAVIEISQRPHQSHPISSVAFLR